VGQVEQDGKGKSKEAETLEIPPQSAGHIDQFQPKKKKKKKIYIYIYIYIYIFFKNFFLF
jgi:hypothetical protein